MINPTWKELTCPNCSAMEVFPLASKEYICRCCGYDFLDPIKLDEKLNLADEKFLNKGILEILGFKEEKFINKRTLFLLTTISFLAISFYLFLLDCEMFPISIRNGAFFLLSYVFSFFTTYLAYKYLNSFFQIEELLLFFLNNFLDKKVLYKRCGGTLPSKSEIFVLISFLLFCSSLIFNYFTLYAINDFSSALSPERTYKFISKESKLVKDKKKNEYYQLYSINFSDYNKTNSNIITIQVDESAWNTYKNDSKATINVRKGLIENVIWSLKQ